MIWKKLTDEQKAARVEAIRNYRRLHPDKVKQWNQNYILHAARRIQNDRLKGAKNEDE